MLIYAVIPELADARPPRVRFGTANTSWNFARGYWVSDYPPTYAVRVVPWDGQVPTEGRSLALCGFDAAGQLAARVFNADGQRTDFADAQLQANRLRRLVKLNAGQTPSLDDTVWILHYLQIAHGGMPFDALDSPAYLPLMSRGLTPSHRSVFTLDAPTPPGPRLSTAEARLALPAGTVAPTPHVRPQATHAQPRGALRLR